LRRERADKLEQRDVGSGEMGEKLFQLELRMPRDTRDLL